MISVALLPTWIGVVSPGLDRASVLDCGWGTGAREGASKNKEEGAIAEPSYSVSATTPAASIKQNACREHGLAMSISTLSIL